MPIQVRLGDFNNLLDYGLERLENFLNQMHKAGLLEGVNDSGLILIADDQFVNR